MYIINYFRFQLFSLLEIVRKYFGNLLFGQTVIIVRIEDLPNISKNILPESKNELFIDKTQRLPIPFFSAVSKPHNKQFIEIVSVVNVNSEFRGSNEQSYRFVKL